MNRPRNDALMKPNAVSITIRGKARTPSIVAGLVALLLTLWGWPSAATGGGPAARIEWSPRVVRTPGPVESSTSLLTARFDNAPLAEALAELASAVPFRVTFRGDATAPVSARFEGIDVEDAVRRLLRGRSFTLVFSDPASDAGEAPRLLEVVVFAKGGAVNAGGRAADNAVIGLHSPPGEPTATDHYAARSPARRVSGRAPAELATRDPDPRRRVSALQALGRRGATERTLVAFEAALEDEDAAVRVRALQLFAELDRYPSVAQFSRLLHGDSSPAVRREAIRLLGAVATEDALELARQLTSDHDAEVRQRARALVRTPPRPLSEWTLADTVAARDARDRPQAP